jgi:hypothetical protein
MLKMVSNKSMLLLGAVLALCAFVVPSVASAASWTPFGTTDGRIDSANLGFSVAALNAGWSCTATTFSVRVDSAALMTVTGASFENCHGDVGIGVGCTVTATGTGFPWSMTAPDTTTVQIHGDDVDAVWETTPGTPNECVSNGSNMRVTGTFTFSYTPVPKLFDIGGGGGSGTLHLLGIGSFPGVWRGSAAATGLLNVIM